MVKIDTKKWQTVTKILALSLGQEQKREEARDQALRLEVQKHLGEDKLQFAKMKAAEIVRIRNRIDLYEVIKIYVQQLNYDIPIVQRSPSCPETMVQQIHSLIYATNTISIKHLLELSDLFKYAFGKEFYNLAKSEQSYAEQGFKDAVMFHQPSQEQLDAIIAEVNEMALRQNRAVEDYNMIKKQEKIANDIINKGDGTAPPPASSGNNGDDDIEALRKRLASI